MRTVDVQLYPGGSYERSLTQNEFCIKYKTPFTPSKGAKQNLDKALRRWLIDYDMETPNSNHALTPYQQWVLLIVHNSCLVYPKIRPATVKKFILENREQLRKKVYETRRISKDTASNGVSQPLGQ